MGVEMVCDEGYSVYRSAAHLRRVAVGCFEWTETHRDVGRATAPKWL